ncbi:RING-H2 finger protein ATL8 [Camellia lanceoleosa]|uniref:RING-H2 finger protein ATL8 n=1 Tax=Camellia lanceoleosa TaxID=1840588 RepID=A0ACC0I4C5_9ERIC|nr:RING-H2 finger protein ATL8 [Camellia lanceoleosa]
MTRPTRFLNTVNSSSSPSTTAAQPPEAVAVESDFVVILAALLCALICVVGLIAVARCAWLRRASTVSSNAASNKGLKKKILQSLPKFTYDSSAAAATKLGGAECAICLEKYADGDEIRVLPQCGHGFHVTCIDTWLGSHSSCPSCRQIFVVTRCRKCGEAAGGGGGGGGRSEAELKAREDAVSSSSSSSSGFLPF